MRSYKYILRTEYCLHQHTLVVWNCIMFKSEVARVNLVSAPPPPHAPSPPPSPRPQTSVVGLLTVPRRLLGSGLYLFVRLLFIYSHVVFVLPLLNPHLSSFGASGRLCFVIVASWVSSLIFIQNSLGN